MFMICSFILYKDTIMTQTATAPRKPRQSSGSTLRSSERAKQGWSPERRAKHAAAIRIWAPWAKSTGPRTIAGKKRSALNALKHGNCDRTTRFFKAALTRHSRLLTGIDLYRRLKRKKVANELLKKMDAYLQKEAREATFMLAFAYELVEINDYSRYRPAND
jgi:hypothetical protein